MRCRYLLLLSASLLVTTAMPASLRAQGAAPAEEKTAETPAVKFNAVIREAQVLQQRKRFLDALMKLDEAEKIDPARAEIYNIRGAVYLSSQMRDFDKARAEFNKAREFDPEALPARFNLAEADFIQGRFAAGEKAFAGVLEKFPKLPISVRHMVLFKQIVCGLKQNKVAQAERLMNDNFTFMDDTPAYYFSKATVALQQKDEKTGNAWLRKSQVIFKKDDSSAYLDTLMEGHYLDSLAVAKPEEEEKGK
ncbi:MAG: tetratricopeptide repeat [Verrucomicrobiaceae bacterium]|nr:tetratricopeptide repeat [Verrucomicrobiaceae bacterium]